MKPTLDLFDLFDLFSSCTEEKFRVRLGVFSYLGGIVVMMTTTLPNTLEGLLLEGQKLYKKVSDADFDDDGDRERTITRATDVLEALQKEISREGVFSANEDLEEVSTEMLPLLAADFYLGSLITKLPFNNPDARHKMLKRAESLLFRYLDTCERLVLFEEADLGAWQSMCKDGERSSTASLREVITREQKVERFRRQKRIRLKMEEIEHELSHDDARDERRRERSLLLLASLAADALDEVSGMSKEMEMIEHRLKFREHDADKKQTRHGHGTADTRKTGLEVTYISRVGGSLNIRKEEVRAGVFKPTVAPPTMTVEEYGGIELERARRRQEVEKGPSSTTRRYNQLEIDGDEDDEELVEKAVHRDREWDDWKDEHPRGSGNKANKII